MYAFKRKLDQISIRQTHQLLFILEFTIDVRASGAENIVADTLSRVDIIMSMPTSLDMQEIADAQASDDELQQLKQSISTSLKLKKVYLIGNSIQYLL